MKTAPRRSGHRETWRQQAHGDHPRASDIVQTCRHSACAFLMGTIATAPSNLALLACFGWVCCGELCEQFQYLAIRFAIADFQGLASAPPAPPSSCDSESWHSAILAQCDKLRHLLQAPVWLGRRRCPFQLAPELLASNCSMTKASSDWQSSRLPGQNLM